MLILLEGVDNCGKSTQAKKLFNLLNSNGNHTIIIPCSNFKTNSKDVKQANLDFNKKLMTKLSQLCDDPNFNVICDRSWLGEWVYGQLYRNYRQVEIFDFEEIFEDISVIPVLFYDVVENIISRDDGFSFSIDPKRKLEEINLFFEAFNLTKFKNQLIININGKDENMVFNELINGINQYAKC